MFDEHIFIFFSSVFFSIYLIYIQIFFFVCSYFFLQAGVKELKAIHSAMGDADLAATIADFLFEYSDRLDKSEIGDWLSTDEGTRAHDHTYNQRDRKMASTKKFKRKKQFVTTNAIPLPPANEKKLKKKEKKQPITLKKNTQHQTRRTC